MKHLQWIILGVVFTAGFVGCGKSEKPNFVYAPQMHYSPAIKAQEEGNALPVKGTVSRNQFNYPYKKDDTDENLSRAAREFVNPLKRTKTVLVRGQTMYNTYCLVCHGQYGEGDGTIVPKYPRPPSLQSEKIQDWTDGRIFHNITVGQNLMMGYGSQVDVEDRWAIIHYIRVLQRAKNPTASDLKLLERYNKEGLKGI